MSFLSPGDNITSNHSILFSDPGNESQGSGGSKTPSESRIAQLVAEILHDTFSWMLSKRGSAWAFCSPGDKKDITFLYINKCTFYIDTYLFKRNTGVFFVNGRLGSHRPYCTSLLPQGGLV